MLAALGPSALCHLVECTWPFGPTSLYHGAASIHEHVENSISQRATKSQNHKMLQSQELSHVSLAALVFRDQEMAPTECTVTAPFPESGQHLLSCCKSLHSNHSVTSAGECCCCFIVPFVMSLCTHVCKHRVT